MSGRTKPRTHRKWHAKRNPFEHLQAHASLLTPAEIEQVQAPKRAALESARRATLSRREWEVLCTALHVAEAIETKGVVRGLAQVLTAARQVLEATGESMDLPTGWTPHALRGPELDALDTLIWTHQRQIEQLQYNEYQAACALAEGRVASHGGVIVHGHGRAAA